MPEFDDFKPPPPPRGVPFFFGSVIGFIATAVLVFFIGLATLGNSAHSTAFFGMLLFLFAVAAMVGYARVAVIKPWPAKYWILGLIAGCCVALLLQGLCFTAMNGL